MAINQISTANTFEEWLTTTSTLVAVANNLTDNTGGGFVMNSAIFIQGSDASLNVRTHANINTLTVNTANIANVLVSSSNVSIPLDILVGRNANIVGNIASANITNKLFVGGDTFLYGNLTISGNTTLDAIGFNDLSISGNAAIAQTLSVTGNTIATNLQLSGNISAANVTSNLSVGNETILYNRITAPNANISVLNVGQTLTVQSLNVWGNVVSANVTGNVSIGNETILYNRVTAPNANISVLNVSNRITVQTANIWGNVVSANITQNLAVGGDAFIYGNLTITGNTTLDAIGFNDLSVAGSVNSTNLNTSTANITSLTGTSNTAIYASISAAIDSSIAFAIALGG